MADLWPEPRTALLAARQAFTRGNLAESDALCRSVLAAEPQNVEAMLLLADIAARSGRTSQASQLLRNVLALDPNNVKALITLARILRTVRGQAEAVELCQRAISIEPNNSELYFIQGICYIDLWRVLEAVDVLREAVRLNSRHGPAFDRLGYALFVRGMYDESIAAFERAVSLMPDVPNSLVYLGKLRELRGDADSASRAYEHATNVALKGLQPMLALAKTHQSVGNVDHAEASLRSARALAPTAVQPQIELAQMLQETGKFDEAAELLESCLNSHPENSRLTMELVYSRRITADDSNLQTMIRTQLQRTNLTPEDRILYSFALGKALDDLEQFEESMVHFRVANRVAREIAPPSQQDRASHSKLVDSMISTFTPQFFSQHVGMGSASEEPVFIVGMPRSGTTLLERFISGHGRVTSVGELSYLSGRAIQLVDPTETPKQENITELVEGYLRQIRLDSKGALRVTDKMPNNFMLAGIIHLIFPNARIINCRRNPIDTCLSIFVTPIIVDFSHSLTDIAFSHHEYMRVTSHWRSVLPQNRFTDVDYEDLVSNPEPHLRRIARFLGLPWDEAMLNHAANHRSVSTASRWQVRQPLHTRSIERWRRYEPWIPELLAEFPDFISSPGRSRLL